jgi:arylsulfatase A-like enzyme
VRARLFPFLLLALGCADARRPNLVLVSIDSLRADHLHSYGYRRETSPHIDSLADAGVLFENATSTTSWTLPAHASLFTGLPKSSHGCVSASRPLADERATLAEALAAHGYHTAAFWSGPYLHPRFGLDQGFDEYVNCASYDFESGVMEANRKSHEDVTGHRVLAELEAWFERRPDAPFFLFVHLWDVHYDYHPPPPFDALFDRGYEGPIDGSDVLVAVQTARKRDLRHLIALYDAEIAWTDHQVGELLGYLERYAGGEPTAVFVTSDHGEEFFEHGEFGHRKQLFEESIRVPLVARFPGRFASGARLSEPVSVVDVAPTLLELAGAPPLPRTWGRSLLAALEQGEGPALVPTVSELGMREKAVTTIQTGRWKALFAAEGDAPIGLWDLESDPAERNNLAGSVDAPDAATFRAARERLAELARAHALESEPETEPMPEGLEQSLRDLGYLGEDE